MQKSKCSSVGLGLLFLATVLIAGCASQPPSPSYPEWVRLPSRTIDNGYIVYVGSDDDPLADQAEFKAEGKALEDLANECSFVPKGARIEDRFRAPAGNGSGLKQAWVKVAVEYDTCEQAKHATDPERIRQIANTSFTEQIKRYQAQIDDNSDETADEAVELNAPEAPIAVNDDTTLFSARRSIVVIKERIILASPAERIEPAKLASLNSRVERVVTYERKNPLVASTAHTWSTWGRGAVKRARAPGIRQAKFVSDQSRFVGRRFSSREGGSLMTPAPAFEPALKSVKPGKMKKARRVRR